MIVSSHARLRTKGLGLVTSLRNTEKNDNKKQKQMHLSTKLLLRYSLTYTSVSYFLLNNIRWSYNQ